MSSLSKGQGGLIYSLKQAGIAQETESLNLQVYRQTILSSVRLNLRVLPDPYQQCCLLLNSFKRGFLALSTRSEIAHVFESTNARAHHLRTGHTGRQNVSIRDVERIGFAHCPMRGWLPEVMSMHTASYAPPCSNP